MIKTTITGLTRSIIAAALCLPMLSTAIEASEVSIIPLVDGETLTGTPVAYMVVSPDGKHHYPVNQPNITGNRATFNARVLYKRHSVCAYTATHYNCTNFVFGGAPFTVNIHMRERENAN